MRVGHEGGAAACDMGTLLLPTVQGRGLLLLQGYGPITVLPQASVAGNHKASLVSLPASSACSGI